MLSHIMSDSSPHRELTTDEMLIIFLAVSRYRAIQRLNQIVRRRIVLTRMMSMSSW